MFDALADKFAVLERKHEEFVVVKKDAFECSTCKKKFYSK